MRKLICFSLLSLMMPLCVFSAETFTLHTSSFTPNQRMPATYTCDGKDTSPELDWSAIPDNTKSLTLIFTDLTASTGILYHWVLYNIPPEVLSLSEGIMDNIKSLPTGVKVAKNSFNKIGYSGPCPPVGETHTYKFTLYALNKIPTWPENSDAVSIMHAIENSVISSVTIDTTYGR